MKAKIRPAVLIAMLVVLTACNKGGDPSTPSAMREGADFSYAVQIFTPADAEDAFEFQNVAGFNDIALGSLAYGNQSPNKQGKQVNINGYGTAAVSLLRCDTYSPDDPFHPVFRWLKENGTVPGTPTTIDWVTDWDNYIGGGLFPAKFAAPKCDAIYLEDDHMIELAVCYQIEGLYPAYINMVLGSNFHETNDEWDIGLTILQWPEANFPTGEPSRKDFLIPDMGLGEQKPDYEPDLAYNHDTGDLYIVYSDERTPIGIVKNIIQYVMFTRSGTDL
ncbi:MAG: hypothetical protein ABIC40_03840, partial [bacterium]